LVAWSKFEMYIVLKLKSIELSINKSLSLCVAITQVIDYYLSSE